MSGDVLNPDLRGFATQRGIGLLAKPFDIDSVVRVVKEVIAQAETTDVAPLDQPRAARRRVRAVPRKPHVLALDDEPSIRLFLRKAITTAGMDCTPSQDGAAALDVLREVQFDVMLIDHRMPGMDGTEFYEAAISFRPELAHRAIFMSGDVLNPDLRGFATQRGIGLLGKPFDIDTVVNAVKEVLAQAGLVGQG
jgi:CheY-like chemotaxis protein